ncbi:hypothetical protein IFM89_037814 [Coptis chinensis]|uniref:R13L1/DRL21-like LRR repeat region domain-containing protein n=1 Tax=Coptis chinensis TaxID=261450 RepID=A0A835H8G2_9MAGN|nr:hypothetical protein IFM89_037814 [Coptis chinensis]
MLPKNLSNMRKLRKLVIGSEIYSIEGPKLTRMPLGIGELTCLKNLSTFVVSRLSDYAGIQELEKLEHLEGELTINGLQNVLDPKDAYKANLRSKEKLLTLTLRWPVGVSDVEIECNNSKEVLEAIQPHPNVKRSTSTKPYTSTTVVHRQLRQTEKASYGGGFGALQKLRIWDCPELEIMSVDFQHLISLEDLKLQWFPQLTSLPEEIQHARRLQTLEIRVCKNLRKLPVLTSLRIINCHPELHRRCCEDWNRIPNLRVENFVEL